MFSLQYAITVHLCLKDLVLKDTAYHFNKSDIDHTHLKQKFKENTQITFASPAKKPDTLHGYMQVQ